MHGPSRTGDGRHVRPYVPVRRDRRPRAQQAVARAARPGGVRAAARRGSTCSASRAPRAPRRCASWPTRRARGRPAGHDRTAGRSSSTGSRPSTAPPTSPSSTSGSRKALDERPGERLTYLSVAPSLFGEIAARLAGIGLGREAHGALAAGDREAVRRGPRQLRVELRAQLHEHFDEEQLLRIDHYLGKEAAQNLLVLRFVNGIFEPLWDRRSIESIQVTVAEDGGVDGRGDFYDATGRAARRRPEPPAAAARADADGRADPRPGRRAARRAPEGAARDPARQRADAVLGQYEGYGDEEGIKDGSRTDTYAAMRVEVDNWRWAGVPCYLRTGKRLTAKQAEIAIAFRPSPHIPFAVSDGWAGANRLIIGIQPGEHVQLHVTGKRPGAGSGPRQGRARLRRGRGGRARRPGGLRAAARRRAGRRQHAVHLQRRGRGPVGGRRAAGARPPATRIPYAPGSAGPRRPRPPGPRRTKVAPAG